MFDVCVCTGLWGHGSWGLKCRDPFPLSVTQRNNLPLFAIQAEAGLNLVSGLGPFPGLETVSKLDSNLLTSK